MASAEKSQYWIPNVNINEKVIPQEIGHHRSSPAFTKSGITSYGTSSAFSKSVNPDEDWTKISDLAERRRMQHRIAQRNYRKKLKRRLEDLERSAVLSSASPPQTHQELKENSLKLPQHSRNGSPNSDRLVIAIDYGTTFTGVTYATTEFADSKREIEIVDSWGSKLGSDRMVPSHISYRPTNSTREERWGFDLSPDATGIVHHEREIDVQVPFWKRAYIKATDYKRKAIQVVLNGKTYFARPDSGSDRNIMTEAFARDCGAKIQRGKDDFGQFKVGTGKCIQSIGRALIPLKLLSGGDSEEQFWFHIIPKCPVPLIMGAEFLRKIQLFTRNKHLLVECPFISGSFPTLKWIGSPQGELDFFANGQLITGCADTGSDLDLISLDCAIANGFEIDKRRCSRTRVMLADESVVETVGQVRMSSVQLPGFGSFEMSFHVLPNLVCDVIFGEEFLEQMDAFNTCNIVDSADPMSLYSLNPFINLGPIQSFLSRRSAMKKSDTSTMQQQHDSEIEAEIYLRNKANRLILKMKDEYQAEKAKTIEETRRRAFHLKHVRCKHCSGLPVPLEHQGEALDELGPVSVRVAS